MYLWYLLDTFWRKSKKWRRRERFLSGSTQDSRMVAEVLSSSVGSCWALRKASCSSVGNAGSGSSLKNCFTRPATSQGSAVDRHSSPASTLAWTERTRPSCNKTGSGALKQSKVNFSHHSPWVPSGEWRSLIFWTGPLCRHVPAASYMHQPGS